MKNARVLATRVAIITAISLLVFVFAACQLDGPAAKALLSGRQSSAQGSSSSVILGTASSFAVIGYAGVTNADASVIIGDLGAGPATNSATGWDLEQNTIVGTGVTDGLGLVDGTIYSGGPVELQAYNDAVLAYAYLVAQVPGTTLGDVFQLDGVTFTPGVYKFPSSANLQVNGTLTLDFQGNPDALFIFQLGSTLVTMADSKVVAINAGAASTASLAACLKPGDDDDDPVDPGDGSSCLGSNVYWAVGSSATIDGAEFIGTVIAIATITMTSAANTSPDPLIAPRSYVSGRMFALGASVTMVNSTIGICAGSGGGTVPPKPCEDFVTGGGWINGDDKDHKWNKWNKWGKNDKATFGVSGGIKHGEYWGQLSFEDHGRDGIKVKSTSVTAYIVIDAVTRQIEGVARVNGRGAFTYTVVVVDNGEPGHKYGRSNDSFSLVLSNGYTASGDLKGGNIQIHRNCGKWPNHRDNDKYDDDEKDWSKDYDRD